MLAARLDLLPLRRGNAGFVGSPIGTDYGAAPIGARQLTVRRLLVLRWASMGVPSQRASGLALAMFALSTGCSSNNDSSVTKQASGGADSASLGGNGVTSSSSGGSTNAASTTTGGTSSATSATSGGTTSATSATGGSTANCPWGDQKEQSTPYGQGTILRICPVSITTYAQRYEFTIPSSPAAGGYVIFNYRNVPQNFWLAAEITPAGESTLSPSVEGSGSGKDVDAWLAAAAGAHFYLDLGDAVVREIPNPPCTLTATYIPVPDPYEPNSQNANATPVTLGTPLVAYAFSGAQSGTGGMSDIQFDSYQVTLAPGSATVSLSNAPTDMRLSVAFTGSSIPYQSGSTSTDGRSVQLNPTITTAGKYYITISPFFSIFSHTGSGTSLPNWVTQPYTLLVTQP